MFCIEALSRGTSRASMRMGHTHHGFLLMYRIDCERILYWITGAPLRPTRRTVLCAIIHEMLKTGNPYADLNMLEISQLTGVSHRRVAYFLADLRRTRLIVETRPDRLRDIRRRVRFYLGPDLEKLVVKSVPLAVLPREERKALNEASTRPQTAKRGESCA